MINVTKTFLPPLEEYQNRIAKVFQNEWLTNRGEMNQELELELKSYLGLDWITLTNNGTIPIQIALKILGGQGEIITTPFSYVATTAAIVWENCTPVFVDIDPEYLTIDETKIEAAITDKTTCILATHVFGNPCNIEVIEDIAERHNLYVIYDAAHCFGGTYKGESIFKYGDVSTCSFHATKLFHTGEGGAMFCKDKTLQSKLHYSHNFGHDGPLKFHGLGINAKLSELQAAMGLSVLPYMEHVIAERRQVVELYQKFLDLSKLSTMKLRENTSWNYSYFPVVFEGESKMLEIVEALNASNIFPRRYFYPSLNTLDYVHSETMNVSESIAQTVLCLPLYVGLSNEDVKRIIGIINSNL